jgi:hypothetical protein
MKIVSIFAIVEESLYSAQFAEDGNDELSNTFENWNDPEYLKLFFEEHIQDLQSGFYGNITIEEAIGNTLEEAEVLENQLYETAINGKQNEQFTLQSLFKPLNDNETNTPPLQKNKLKGFNKKSWLRIYAIRIGPNLFVISGGAIKLTHKMDREHLKHEIRKLEITKDYLKSKGIFDEYDFVYLEL